MLSDRKSDGIVLRWCDPFSPFIACIQIAARLVKVTHSQAVDKDPGKNVGHDKIQWQLANQVYRIVAMRFGRGHWIKRWRHVQAEWSWNSFFRHWQSVIKLVDLVIKKENQSGTLWPCVTMQIMNLCWACYPPAIAMNHTNGRIIPCHWSPSYIFKH